MSGKDRKDELNEQLRKALQDGDSAKFAQILEQLTGSKDAANEFLRRVIGKIPAPPVASPRTPSSDTFSVSTITTTTTTTTTSRKDTDKGGLHEYKEIATTESSVSESISVGSSIPPVPITPAVLTEAEFTLLSSIILKSINLDAEDSAVSATTGSVETSLSKSSKSS